MRDIILIISDGASKRHFTMCHNMDHENTQTFSESFSRFLPKLSLDAKWIISRYFSIMSFLSVLRVSASYGYVEALVF